MVSRAIKWYGMVWYGKVGYGMVELGGVGEAMVAVSGHLRCLRGTGPPSPLSLGLTWGKQTIVRSQGLGQACPACPACIVSWVAGPYLEGGQYQDMGGRGGCLLHCLIKDQDYITLSRDTGSDQ